MVLNKTQLETWLKQLDVSGYQLYRYHRYPIKHLDMNYMEELEKHAELWKVDPNHFTFHHLRNLFQHLKNNTIMYPMVGTMDQEEINIDPGGSRLMVSKYLNVEHTILDLICKKGTHNPDLEYEVIDTVEKFCSIYNKSTSDYHIQFDRNDPQNAKMQEWYQINWNNMMHYSKIDINGFNKQFYEMYKNSKDKIDLYFL